MRQHVELLKENGAEVAANYKFEGQAINPAKHLQDGNPNKAMAEEAQTLIRSNSSINHCKTS